MDTQEIIKEAEQLQDEMVAIRRELHRRPETGFELIFTKALVKQKLEEYGYQPIELGRAGLVALAGGKTPGKTILLRADMDAFPIKEEADVEYRSKYAGRMHCSGHDLHTAMLLGAAKLLKAHEDEIKGTIKLAFQPAEEIFQGAQDMINAGMLEDPHVDAAVMLRVSAGMPLSTGMVVVMDGGITASSCEQYHITVKGKSGHGSAPYDSIDPITAAAHIHIALQEINSRELEGSQFGIFTTGRFEAGSVSNVIPDTAEMWGTIRTTDLNDEVGGLIRTRMMQICEGIGAAFRCETEVEFFDHCPCMVMDMELSADTSKYMKEMFGESVINISGMNGGRPSGRSEDFAFVSHQVPTTAILLIAGGLSDGYLYGQHHPKVKFDESVLYRGCAAYAYNALAWLSEH